MRRFVSLTVCLAVLLSAPGSANARQLVKPPAVDALILHQPCPVGGGTCADPYARIIYLSARDPFALEHERGHIFDAEILTAGTRALFTRLLGLRANIVWAPSTGEGCAMTACPSELFADAYAVCRLGIHRERYRGVTRWAASYGYTPTPTQHFRICTTMRRVYFQAFGLSRATRDRRSPNRRARTGRI